ncbi:MAG: T9SS type A sorting domain-containing protein [Ignavibacteriae bacterium]|nr:T9SS type A sorting domain-containing protein [Ignavibacteriota bacterium]
MNKSVLLIVLTSLFILWCGFEVLHPTGEVGRTKKNPNDNGCYCHSPGIPTDTILVYVEGPETVSVGSSNIYTLHMIGGPSVIGGFNVAIGRGSLQSLDVSTRLENGELTHTQPKSWGDAIVSWQFMYIAPPTSGEDTIFSLGNSCNDDESPVGDEYNFGDNFYVTVIDSPLGVSEDKFPNSFELFQNFPNPFNPSTVISYQVIAGGWVSLKVFDLNGKEVSTLVNEAQSPGLYSIKFDGSGLTSGIYYYQLMTDEIKLTKKLLLLR